MNRPRASAARRKVQLGDLIRHPRPGMDHPTQVEFTRDGRGITYLAPEPGGNTRSLWRLDLAHGTSSLLAAAVDQPRTLTRAEQLSRQRRRETSWGITAYRRALAADVITMRDRGRWLVSRDGKPAVEVPGIRNATAVYPDPAGRRIAWASAGDLWCADLADDAAQSRAAARRLSQDGRPGVSNGLEDYLAAEELDRFDGAWWSMGGGELLFAHVDERHIPLVDIAAGQDLAGQTPGEAYRYPFAGGPNPRTTLRIAAADGPGLRDVSIDFGDGYLARVLPHPLGGWLVAALPRDQHSLHWYLVQPSGAATELWAEHAQPWINLDEATRILSDGRVVRASEATGFRHLELRAADGTLLRRLTGGEWVVTDLAHVDEARAEVLFIGTADSVLERHLYVVPLDATQPVQGPRRLTTEPGWHAVTVSDDGKRWVDSWSSRDLPTQVVVRSRDGSSDVVVHEASSTPEGAGLVVPDLLTVPAADGATPIHVALFHPPRASDAPPGPTVVWVYGGPHSQYVRESWELTVEPFRQALVRTGFTVILADNRGTANRGLRFESPIAGAFGDVEIDDQVAVLDALARRGEVDLERVAISGSSYGGFLTVRAMTIRPDLFRAGVAWAPVVDWAGYDTAYTERYLALPTTNAEGYRRSSLLTRVGDLQGRLLVTHGTVDENVHPRHTERLLAALRAAGRDADSAMLPRERHLLERPLARRRWLTLALDHLRDAMGRPSRSGAAPRAQAAS